MISLRRLGLGVSDLYLLIYNYTPRFLEEDRKEMSDLRRQHQELLNVEVGLLLHIIFM